MKKVVWLFSLCLVLFACKEPMLEIELKSPKEDINQLINQWHKDAANAKLEPYLALMHQESVYIGTDGTENWNKSAFRLFCEPHFAKGKAWDFTCLERNIYSSDDQQMVWFDEILETALGPCRGSGVLIMSNSEWKLKQYVLSMLVDNKDISTVLDVKQYNDSIFIKDTQFKNALDKNLN